MTDRKIALLKKILQYNAKKPLYMRIIPKDNTIPTPLENVSFKMPLVKDNAISEILKKHNIPLTEKECLTTTED